MHSLVGIFLEDMPEEDLGDSTTLYPFKLIFPPNKERVFYLLSKEGKEKWINAIKEVIGY